MGKASTPSPIAAPGRLVLVFAVLFITYQLPEGSGMRTLHSFPIQAALMLAFLPIAWLAGRALGFRGRDAWFMKRSPRWAVLANAAASRRSAWLAPRPCCRARSGPCSRPSSRRSPKTSSRAAS